MKRLLISIMIIILCLTLAGQAKIPDQDMINLVEQLGCQIRIPLLMVSRSTSFYKFEAGDKLSAKKIELLTDEEKTWYEQGYIVKYGEWIGDDESEKDKLVEVAIYGSGSIIFSDILPEALQSSSKEIVVLKNTYGSTYQEVSTNEKGTYAETLVMTNYHVIEPLIDEKALGSKKFPLSVYAEADIITEIDPPSARIVEGARPISQKYYVMMDEEGAVKSWEADGNEAEIRIKVDQDYAIKGKVVGFDKGLDVGIISIKNVAFQPYAKFRETPCVVGERVWIRHSPMAMRFSTDRGYVNQTGLDLGVDRNGLGWNNQVKLDIPSAPGSSGSPIFDEEGYIIALFHGGLIHQLGQGYSFIEGGHLAHSGVAVAEWLKWQGFSYIFDTELYKGQSELIERYCIPSKPLQ